jgi:hypothetical protein
MDCDVGPPTPEQMSVLLAMGVSPYDEILKFVYDTAMKLVDETIIRRGGNPADFAPPNPRNVVEKYDKSEFLRYLADVERRLRSLDDGS